jgi:anti-anti-sigma regulatory factor
MATQPPGPRGLELEGKANETIVHCKGKITAENSEVFQREIRNLIPESSGQIAAITYRIVIDLSNVTQVDSMGLGGRQHKANAATSKSQT